MKKLLLPLIILLLIIGYFMSQKSDHTADDAYDKMEQPKSEGMDSTEPDSTMPDSTTPPDMDSDPTMPQESDDVAPETDNPQSSESLMDETKDAADEAGDKLKEAAEDTGDAIEDAAKKAGEAVEEAGEATKDAAEDALDKIRGDEPEKSDEPQE